MIVKDILEFPPKHKHNNFITLLIIWLQSYEGFCQVFAPNGQNLTKLCKHPQNFLCMSSFVKLGHCLLHMHIYSKLHTNLLHVVKQHFLKSTRQSSEEAQYKLFGGTHTHTLLNHTHHSSTVSRQKACTVDEWILWFQKCHDSGLSFDIVIAPASETRGSKILHLWWEESCFFSLCFNDWHAPHRINYSTFHHLFSSQDIH